MKIHFHKLQTPTEPALVAIKRACNRDHLALVKQIAQGVAELWQINETLFLVTRFEARENSRELVVCAASGSGLFALMPALVYAAKQIGATSMRFHSLRPGMGRALAPFGFVNTHARDEFGAVIYLAEGV